MAVTRRAKEDILQVLLEKFSRSKSVIFAANSGLSVEEISNLRKELRTKNIDFQIAKKTLLLKVLDENKIEGLNRELLNGAVGAVFSYDDQIAPAKILAKFGKKNDKITMVAGVMDGKLLSTKEVLALSTLPSREELLAKLMGSMLSPLSGFVGMRNAVIGGFVRALDQLQKKQGVA